MFKNYFKTAYRNLLRNKGFTFLNVFGLTLGVATCLLIVLYVVDELSYDRYNVSANRIYRVNTDLKVNGKVTYFASAAPAVAVTLRAHYPEVEKAVRIYHAEARRFRKGSAEIEEEQTFVCDPEIFSVFTLPMIEGDPVTALKAPHTAVLTESAARRFFNTTHIIGKTLVRAEDTSVLTITGVIRDMPVQSHFRGEIFLSMRGSDLDRNNNYYALFPISTYVLLKPGADAGALRQKLSLFMDTWQKGYSKVDTNTFFMRLGMTALTDIHLRSSRSDELGSNSDIKYVYIFLVVGAFVLLIAAINFMNLSTARSAGRAKEVGVRKVLGSLRGQLIAQFLSESLLVTLIAAVLGVLVTVVSLHWFNHLADKEIVITCYMMGWLGLCLVGIVVAVGLLAGAWPAFFLSGFKPIEVLKGKLSKGFKGGGLRSVLVVFQFGISLFLIAGTIVVYNQLHYIRSKDLGFERSHVLIIKNVGSLSNPVTLKKEVLQLPGVEAATLSAFLPTNQQRWHNFGTLQGSVNSLQTQLWRVDADYVTAMDMRIFEGRNFSPVMGTDSTGIIINETAAKLYGIAGDPLNKVISFPYFGGKKSFHTIGVVKDFNFASLRDNITPLAMVMDQDGNAQLCVKVSGGNLPVTMRQLKDKWADLSPHQAFEYSFMDADFDAMYRSEQRIGKLSILFAVLAIAIACLGLFGLAAYAAEQRTREISIRKVLGASIPSVFGLLTKDFLKLIGFAVLIASPVSWWLLQKWLEDFAYRIDMSGWFLVVAAVMLSVIALVTVSWQALKAARVNPVDSLKSE
ncbi:MAG TPA: ABC transporter permease [Puia sp.]|jgi:putative ABC transport system permease protein